MAGVEHQGESAVAEAGRSVHQNLATTTSQVAESRTTTFRSQCRKDPALNARGPEVVSLRR